MKTSPLGPMVEACAGCLPTSRAKLQRGIRILAALTLLASAAPGIASDFISAGNGPAPAAAAAAGTAPCRPSDGPGYMTPAGLSDKQADAGFANAMVGGGSPKPDQTQTPGSGAAAAVNAALGSTTAEDILTDRMTRKAIDPGPPARAAKENSELDAHVAQLYEEYRSLARDGRINPALRDLYAREKIGPRLDTIYVNEMNWLGRQAVRSRMAGQVQARLRLVEIEREEGEKEALRHADDLVVAQEKYKNDSKDRDYQVTPREVMRKNSLAVFRLSFEASPQNVEAQRVRKLQRELEAAEEQSKQNRIDCPSPKPIPVALPRRGGNSGSAIFQNAIDQAEQDERDRPAREARERALAAERARDAPARAAADARAQQQQQEQARQDERAVGELAQALADLARAIAQSRNKGGTSQGAPSGAIAVCTPGSGYDAKRCSCSLNPSEIGCRGVR